MAKIRDRCEIEGTLKTIFEYRDGGVYYKVDRGKKKAGQKAGTKANGSLYRVLSVDGVKILEHRVIFFLCHGTWPDVIDHINRDKLDNRAENLRGCSGSQNSYNTTRKAIGARLHSCGKWEAYCSQEGKIKHLGYFNCRTAAMVKSALVRQGLSNGFFSPFR